MSIDLQAVDRFFRQVCQDPGHPVSRFWSEYWLDTGHLSRLIRMIGVLDPLLDPRSVLLDVGGFGELPVLLHRFYGLSARAVSLEGNLIGYGGGRLLPAGDQASEIEIRIDQCDVEREPLRVDDASIDLVTCFEVLEHFRTDPMFALLEFHRVLRPGGILLLSTPNANCWESVARIADFDSPFTFSAYFADGSGIGHCKEYSVTEFRLLLENAGFSLESLTTLDVLPPSPSLAGKFSDLAEYLGSRAWWRPELRRQTLLAVARRSGDPKMRKYVPLYTENFRWSGKTIGDRSPAPTAAAASDSLQREVDKLRGYIEDLNGELEVRTTWAQSLDKECREHKGRIAELDSEIAVLKSEFDLRGRWAQSLDRETSQQRIVIREQQDRISDFESKVEDLRWLLRRAWELGRRKLQGRE